jgi:hypothetical protein
LSADAERGASARSNGFIGTRSRKGMVFHRIDDAKGFGEGQPKQMILSFSDIMPDWELSEGLLAGKGLSYSLERAICLEADFNARVRRENLCRNMERRLTGG